jgi:tetratricopeptide (TPR) repeat protein
MPSQRFAGLVWLVLAAGWGCTSVAPLPAKAVELNARGVAALEAGNLESARISFDLALEYSPDFVEALTNQGLAEAQLGNFVRARQLLGRARRINPDVAQPHHGLGVLAERQGRADLASGHYRNALAVDPGFAPSRSNLARLYFDSGNLWQAKVEFEKLVQVAPLDPLAHAGLAETLIRVGRSREADAVVARAQTRLPITPALEVLSARGSLRAGDVDTAIQRLLPLTRRVSEERVQALSWLGVAELMRGRPRHAIGAAEAALALDDQAPVARHVMAVALSRLGDPRALDWQRKAEFRTPTPRPRGRWAP